ncbi:MAG: recombinase family protein [Thermodesulfobacteriota bacterium]
MIDNTIKEHKLIATYYRVSTSAQEENQTIQTQISAVKEFAIKNGYTIVKEYKDDGWSGDTLVRPDLDQLRIDAKQKMWEAVLVYDPDRLARRNSWQEVVMEELKDLGIDVLFVTVPKAKTDEDIIMYKMRGVFSEYERMKIKERFRLGKVRKVKEGHILTTEALYGYTYIPNVKIPNQPKVHGYYEINEDEARVVRMIFKWVANEGLTLRAVVKKLQELEIKPRKSKRGLWATSTLSTMLRHKGYIGEAHWGSSYAVVPENPTSQEKYRKIKKSSRRIKPKEEWIASKIPVPIIIKEELFIRVQEQLKTSFALFDRNKKNEYLLAGRIWCDCGRRRCGCGPQRGKHLYYRCNGRINNFPLPPTCTEGAINARIADRMTWEKLVELMSSPDLIQKQATKRTGNKLSGKHAEGDISSIEKEIKKLSDQEERYTKAYGAGVLSIEQLKEYNLPIRGKIISLETQTAKIRQEQGLVRTPVQPTESEIEAYSQEAIKELNDLNFVTRKAIVMNTIEKVVGTRDKLQVYGYLPIANVGSFTKHRNCRSAECGEIHAL